VGVYVQKHLPSNNLDISEREIYVPDFIVYELKKNKKQNTSYVGIRTTIKVIP
jgi:hypothetical protein